MEKISLYEITEGINKIEEFIDDEEQLTTYLDSLNIQFEDKVSNILKYRRTLELTSDAIKNEIERLSSLKKFYENKGENLKKYVSYSMQKAKKENLELETAKLSFRKSESIEVENASLIPSEYIIIKETKQVDKTAIKKAIKGGDNIPGAVLTTHKNLQIK